MEAMGTDDLRGLRVLLIDDDEDTRDVVRRLLEAAGAEVMPACSAGEGMGLFLAQRPDLLLVDIAMPGEDGFSFMRKVRALDPAAGGQTPAAALTARAVLEDRLESLRAGFQAHMAKPVPPLELIEVMAALAGRAAKPAARKAD
jgi:CheY-like chemotaxis protein